MGQPKVGLDWMVCEDMGWGVIGVYLLRAFAALGVDPRFWLAGNTPADLAPYHLERAGYFRGTMLRASGNRLLHSSLWAQVPADRNIMLPIFEDLTTLDAKSLTRVREYDAVVTFCQWNHDVLAAHGIPSTVIHQGVDFGIFHPRTNPKPAGPPRVFSGGKLEYRKGQDITIAAFKQLLHSHPDAVLVTAWHNYWPHLIAELLTSGLVGTVPADTTADSLTSWLVAEGIPAANQEHHRVPNGPRMADLIRSCDVAVFPSRAEGATNLPAVECVACGVPTLITAATGHLDLTNAYWVMGRPNGQRPEWVDLIPEHLAEVMADTMGRAPTYPPLDPNAWSWDQMARAFLPLLSA